MKFGDCILILLILLAAGSIYGVKMYKNHNEHYRQEDLIAVITINGKEYKTVTLTKEEQVIDIRTEFGHNTLRIYNFGIQMTYSDAPLPIALQMGVISRPRQQIICIPARLMVEVVHPDKSQDSGEELDAII